MRNISFRQQISHFVAANQSAVTFSFLFAAAFAVISVNALFNQFGNHPQPLWPKDENMLTHAISDSAQKMRTNLPDNTRENSVRVRKVKTIHVPAIIAPVPLLRPAKRQSNGDAGTKLVKSKPVDIAQIQRLLQKLGFYSGSLDGLSGPRTLSAIKKFESSKRLAERGNISHSLLLLLETAVESAKSNYRNSSIGQKILQDGLSGRKHANKPSKTTNKISKTPPTRIDPALITRVQVGLINFGSRDVRIDGLMGNQTKAAIKQFQKRFNLDITGLPNKKLIRKLESVGALTQG